MLSSQGCASWFFGNNMAGVPMYDPATGRCFDGLNGTVEWRINRNAGAESTIEALLALLAVSRSPLALRYLDYREVEVRPYVVVEAERGRPAAGKPDLRTRDWTGESYFSNGSYYSLGEGDVLAVPFQAPQPGDYWLYAAYQREAVATRELQLVAPRASAPVTVDGVLDEWAGAPVFSANTARQFLRGAALWRGPDVDSFDVQFMWDDEHLYIAATVRDPASRTKLGRGMASDALYYLTRRARYALSASSPGPNRRGRRCGLIAGTWLPQARLAWQPSHRRRVHLRRRFPGARCA